jgi:hypothetical protein
LPVGGAFPLVFELDGIFGCVGGLNEKKAEGERGEAGEERDDAFHGGDGLIFIQCGPGGGRESSMGGGVGLEYSPECVNLWGP